MGDLPGMSEPRDAPVLISAEEDSRTPPEALLAELQAVLKAGVTIAGLRGCPRILGLAMVGARSVSTGSDDQAVSARSLISEAAARVDGAPVERRSSWAWDGRFAPFIVVMVVAVVAGLARS